MIFQILPVSKSSANLKGMESENVFTWTQISQCCDVLGVMRASVPRHRAEVSSCTCVYNQKDSQEDPILAELSSNHIQRATNLSESQQ